MRTFIGGIASPDSAERSIGARLSERLASDAPINAARVVVADLSADPFEIAEQLNSEWPKFERVILVGEVPRSRAAGTVTAYRWNGNDPNEDDAARTAERDSADFDATLLMVRSLADLPDEIIVVEVEPEISSQRHEALRDARGDSAVERARTLVRRLATNSRAAKTLPECALGGHSRQAD